MTFVAASRDGNSVPALLATSSADGVSLVDVWADPTTHRLLCTFPGGAAGYQQPTSGSVNGTNTTFVWATAPNVISVDGVSKQKVSSDGTVNWTGTTTTVLTIAPNYDIFGIN